jgi:hypothetical protein
MRRFLGHLTWGVSLGVLFASIGASEAKAGPAYAINISITDNTTSTTTVFNIPWNNPNNTAFTSSPQDPNRISVSSAFSTAATGVSLTGLLASTTSTATSTQLGIQGTATVQDASTDSYTIVVTTLNNGYTLPAANVAGIISQSESGTYTFTNSANNNQTFNSWYNASNTPAPSGPNPGLQTITIPNTLSGTQSGSANTPGSTSFAPYVTPYGLTNQITIHVTGNGTSNNSIIAFQGSTVIMAVPEPASLVMLLTGMPMPLMVLGMLRRRKAQRVA